MKNFSLALLFFVSVLSGMQVTLMQQPRDPNPYYFVLLPPDVKAIFDRYAQEVYHNISWATAIGEGDEEIIELLESLDPSYITNQIYLRAFLFGNRKLARLFLSRGGDPNTGGEDTWDSEQRPLGLAAREGHAAVVELLLKVGAQPNYEVVNHLLPIQEAARNNHAHIITMLLAAGAEVNGTSRYSNTALIEAVEAGHVAAVKVLLAAGADPNAKSKKKQNEIDILRLPVCKAAQKGNIEMLTVLLQAGANPHKTTNSKSALYFAQKNHHTQVAELLISLGVKSEVEKKSKAAKDKSWWGVGYGTLNKSPFLG
ncbi:hypothetical protein BH09DEP1_BH09DEP1_4090 [soil metagenome]